MIKIDKLMLGDLVRLTDGQIVKVIAIDVTGNVDVEFETESFHHHVNAHKEDIEPIPLTEDILLGNDFEKTGIFIEVTGYALRENDFCIFYNKEGKYFYAEIANINIEIEYVHQLQHLLRMCELDELADNIKI